MPNPAVPDFRSFLKQSPKTPYVPPTSTYNPYVDAPFFPDAPGFPPRPQGFFPRPPRGSVPVPGAPASGAAPKARPQPSVGGGPDVAAAVRGMNMLQRRDFQTQVMKQVLDLDRKALRGARMETLRNDLTGAFVNNRTLMAKVKKAVGKWALEGGSLADRLADVGAPKWLVKGLSK